VLANDGVSLSVERGEIHALLGENGSGKTTLLSLLYGLVEPDAGEIRVAGKPVTWGHGLRAHEHGIGMVPQRFLLVPTLTVAENIALSVHGGGRHEALLRDVISRVDELQEQVGLALDPRALVRTLSVGERQRVEIVRALYFEPTVLLLDEPTSVLTPDEADLLYGALRALITSSGMSIVLTTHRIREIFQAADRVSVLRRGRNVGTFEAGALTKDQLVRAMIGHKAMPQIDHATAPASRASAFLRVDRLTLSADDANTGRVPPIQDVSFVVSAGEILGIAGVEGNGQTTLEMLLAGLLQASSGAISVSGNATTKRTRSTRGHIGYVPSERDRFGVVRSMSVRDNLLLRKLADTALLHRAPGRPRDSANVDELVNAYSIEPPSAAIRVGHLSGGNAQKVVLARELSREPAITIAAQPTAGLDVAAAASVRAKLHEQSRLGRAVLVISSDLDELLELCDRVCVMYRGRLVGDWPRSSFDRHAIGTAMAGEHGS
jgi:simple sugar transport system ATP-binding protein